MKHSIFSAVAASILLLAAAPGAYAQQTTAGLKVDNNASVTYTVGGVPQTQPVLGDVTFTVDRKVVLSVTELGNAVTSVAPEAVNQALKFTVTNGANDFIDIALVASDAAAATFKGGDGSLTEVGNQVTGATFKLYLDDGLAPGTWDATATELPVDGGGVYYLDGVLPGASIEVFVVADALPDNATLSNDDVMVVQLLGTAHSAYADQRAPTPTEIIDRDAALLASTAYGNSALGAILADNAATADDADEIDNVFAEPADTTEATGNVANDGTDASYDAYKVSSTTISVTKTYGVISDGVSAADPKPIPGAELLYCIAVSNGGTTDATDVTITDTVPTGTTYVANSLVIASSDVTTCAADPVTAFALGTAKTDVVDADEGQSVAGTVTTTVDVAAAAATTTMFKVTVNAF